MVKRLRWRGAENRLRGLAEIRVRHARCWRARQDLHRQGGQWQSVGPVAALEGESRDEIRGWLTVVIQELELKARVEDLESAAK